MALLLEGEAVVESITVSRTELLTIRVLGPGSLVGEVGLTERLRDNPHKLHLYAKLVRAMQLEIDRALVPPRG